MRPKERQGSRGEDLFRMKLVNLLDLRHPLCKLAEKIRWQDLIEEFGALYSDRGRPGIPIRTMVGLTYRMRTPSKDGSKILTGNTSAAKNTSSTSCRLILRK